MIQERTNRGGIQVVEGERGRSLLEVKRHELQEQSEGVAVAHDGVRTRLPLAYQTVREEGLQETWKARQHRHESLPPCERSSRAEAKRRSSGTEERYQ